MKVRFLITLNVCFLLLGSTTTAEPVPNTLVFKRTSIPAMTIITPEYFIPLQYRDYVVSLCKEFNIHVWIFARLINYESGWDRWALNNNDENQDGIIESTDRGIAMLNSKYYDEWKWKYNGGKDFDPFDPWVSLRIAAKHMQVLFKCTRNWEYTVAAYNCGLSRATSRMPWPIRTKRYILEIFGDVQEVARWNSFLPV